MLGGPGATFWMILAGLPGMTTPFVECTLAVMVRRHNHDGSVSGGPVYSLRPYLLALLVKRGLDTHWSELRSGEIRPNRERLAGD